jgi:hypothetical protein
MQTYWFSQKAKTESADMRAYTSLRMPYRIEKGKEEITLKQHPWCQIFASKLYKEPFKHINQMTLNLYA